MRRWAMGDTLSAKPKRWGSQDISTNSPQLHCYNSSRCGATASHFPLHNALPAPVPADIVARLHQGHRIIEAAEPGLHNVCVCWLSLTVLLCCDPSSSSTHPSRRHVHLLPLLLLAEMSIQHRRCHRSSMLFLLPLLLSTLLIATRQVLATSQSAGFNESLLLRPMHDGRVLMHWEFDLHETGMNGQHYTVFPKALGQLLETLHVHSLSLSLSSGRWLADELGYEAHAPSNWNTVSSNGSTVDDMAHVPKPRHAPFGAELWAELDDQADTLDEELDAARFDAGLSTERRNAVAAAVDARWVELQAALAGVFCASLNQMSAQTTSNPELVIRPDRSRNPAKARKSSFRYATLPRESVCTENLAPFVKMLPCRRERGLGSMLNPLKLFRAHYSSIQLRVSPLFDAATGHVAGWHLRQSVSVLLSPKHTLKSPEWSLSQLVGTGAGSDPQGAACACPLSTHASLHVHLTPAFAARFPSSVAQLLDSRAPGSSADAKFELGPLPPHVIRSAKGHTLLSYDLKKMDGSSNAAIVSAAASACPRGALNLAVRYTPAAEQDLPSVFEARDLSELLPSSVFETTASSLLDDESSSLSPLELPIRVQRYLSAASLHSGDWIVHISNPSTEIFYHVDFFEAFPWYLQIQYHTLAITERKNYNEDKNADMTQTDVAVAVPLREEDIRLRHYTPAVQRGTPAQLLLRLRLRPGCTISLSMHFTKAMLSTNEYPPDVSRGFDIGSAIVAVIPKLSASSPSSLNSTMHGMDSSPYMNRPPRVLFYTPGLLLSLPFPDFSMPFNVIAFTCTVIAFFFGSIFNLTQVNHADVLKRKAKIMIDKHGKPIRPTLLKKVLTMLGRKNV